jgi:hypothetical protein
MEKIPGREKGMRCCEGNFFFSVRLAVGMMIGVGCGPTMFEGGGHTTEVSPTVVCCLWKGLSEIWDWIGRYIWDGE